MSHPHPIVGDIRNSLLIARLEADCAREAARLGNCALAEQWAGKTFATITAILLHRYPGLIDLELGPPEEC